MTPTSKRTAFQLVPDCDAEYEEWVYTNTNIASSIVSPSSFSSAQLSLPTALYTTPPLDDIYPSSGHSDGFSSPSWNLPYDGWTYDKAKSPTRLFFTPTQGSTERPRAELLIDHLPAFELPGNGETLPWLSPPPSPSARARPDFVLTTGPSDGLPEIDDHNTRGSDGGGLCTDSRYTVSLPAYDPPHPSASDGSTTPSTPPRAVRVLPRPPRTRRVPTISTYGTVTPPEDNPSGYGLDRSACEVRKRKRSVVELDTDVHKQGYAPEPCKPNRKRQRIRGPQSPQPEAGPSRLPYGAFTPCDHDSLGHLGYYSRHSTRQGSKRKRSDAESDTDIDEDSDDEGYGLHHFTKKIRRVPNVKSPLSEAAPSQLPAEPVSEVRMPHFARSFARVHGSSGAKRHYCPWPDCGHSAGRLWDLNRHFEKHEPTPVKARTCGWCGLVCARIDSAKRHKKICTMRNKAGHQKKGKGTGEDTFK